MNKSLSLLLFVLICFFSFSQEVNKHIAYTNIYDFIDELANVQIIELNSAVKPYSRKFIYEKLAEARQNENKLTERQIKELYFFLRDYNKEIVPNKDFKRRLDLFYYRDSLFQFTANPILGFSYAKNQNGTAFHRRNGGEIYGNVAGKLGFYCSLRDNGINNILAAPNFLTPLSGANYKPFQGTSQQRNDFDEINAGISYGWKWGSVSLLKDNFVWGNNYNGANIFSGKQPSFAYLSFKIKPSKWFEFNYIHGSLISMVLDSSKTYGVGSGLRRSFIPKYLAANLFTVKPYKHVFISLGNSIVYSDKYIQPMYLIPFMFFKSGDRVMNAAGSNSLGENSQMFADISIRAIPKTHLYGTVFIDEVNLGKMFDKTKSTNLMSFKAGARITNLIKNTSFTFEYTRTNPWVYVHPIATTTFESNNYNMGHYLGQNADEMFFGFKYKPVRGLIIDVSKFTARKGGVQNFIQSNGINANVQGKTFMQGVFWSNNTTAIKLSYEIINDLFVFSEFANSKINQHQLLNYTADFYKGNTKTFSFGLTAGF